MSHPDRETGHQCLKHELYLCGACLKCRDPGIYCKHRSACAIWYIEKERRREAGADNAAEPETPDP